ncbi:MAG: hypothetical protein E3J87_07260 [Candidatus Cloacimonadota bacterium]|nr:MAG: hypothetical protein E3J87_07260 [Candidatus Cloacimonadota bacterium]
MPRKKRNRKIEKRINIYIDSDVIVASEIEDERNHDESKKFMDYILETENPDTNFITSVFTFLELASAMIRRTNDENKTYSLLYKIRNSWKYKIRPVAPMQPKKLTSLTRLVDSLVDTAIKFHTPSGDTVHAQTAAWHEIDYLVTWNKRDFSHMEKQIENIKVLTPTELLEEFKKLIV